MQSITDVRDFFAGLVSNLSFGLTDLLFDAVGNVGNRDKCSSYYSAGEWTGTAAGLLVAGKGLYNAGKAGFKKIASKEGINIGKNNVRIAIHDAHHTFDNGLKYQHLQINTFQKGVKGSGKAFRIPFGRGQ